MRNIILCGFMGCGKTTVGRYLARLASLTYVDLDAEIESEQGIPIPEIFAAHGEPYFRDLEHQAVKRLAGRSRCVVSTGGGALTFRRNIDALSPADLVVFLDAAFPVCYQRIRWSDRPIVRSSTPEELHSLFEKRRTFYLEAASFTVDAGQTVEQVAEAVAARYHLLDEREPPEQQFPGKKR